MLSDASVLYVSAGLDSANTSRALERTQEIVADLCERGPTRDEVERARSAVAGRRALAYENSTLAAIDIAEERVLHGRTVSPGELVAALDDVDHEEVVAVAEAMAGTPAIACVGPHTKTDLSAPR